MEIESTAKRTFSRIGFAFFAYGVSSLLLSILGGVVLGLMIRDGIVQDNTWIIVLISTLPICVIGVPLCMLILKKVPVSVREKRTLGRTELIKYMIICFAVMYVGNIIGNVLSGILSGGNAVNEVAELLSDFDPLMIAYSVIVAPLLEEYIFRRQLIDRCVRYGEKTAVLTSALFFGLFHMNLFQFFYAFGVGLVLAYVYVRTNRLRYTVLMHVIINVVGGVITPLIASALDSSVTSGHTVIAAAASEVYSLLLIALVIYGMYLFIKYIKTAYFLPAEDELPDNQNVRIAFGNPGVIHFFIFCGAAIIYSLMS